MGGGDSRHRVTDLPKAVANSFARSSRPNILLPVVERKTGNARCSSPQRRSEDMDTVKPGQEFSTRPAHKRDSLLSMSRWSS
ncbi:hypothetical protein HN011_003784 [Eciton burchellii]|nr:hypothetical protein HN011_003784 [Eciton burchellii]